ncbi:MAG: hypothetical protein FH751_02265 [Firmicutes bacterium]|nr:hypothetical protein [Bacillota bacterium]
MNKGTDLEVKDLFEIEILKNSKVLSGNEGLHRKITKVNVMEVPDILDWVTPGEFLLTTAYSFKDNLNSLIELVPMLNKKGLAGLGIKTKRYIEKIPEEIIDIANKLDFPIIEIPIEASYSEIITSVLSEIINRQTNILTRIDKFHNRLVSVMLSGGSLQGIANAIYESVENSVAISEDIFKSNVIVCDDCNRDEIEKIMLKRDNNKFNFEILNKGLNYYNSVDIIKGIEVERINIPIFIEQQHYGFIYIWQDKKMLSQVELSVIESSISIIALDLVKKLSIFEIENKHRIEFFDNLLSEDPKKYKKAVERARLFDFDVELYYTAIVIKFKNIEESIKFTPNNTNYIQKLHEKLMSIIDKVSVFKKEKTLYANKSDRIIILLGKKNINEVSKKEVLEFCQMIYSYVKKESIDSRISIGIGRTYSKISELYKSYREANRASDNSKDKNENIPIHYDDLGIYRILSYEELKPELYQFYNEILEPLVKYDNEKDSELIETLKKYFECGGNLKKISQRMYIHYNTIIYRIQRIKEIIGIDFEDHNTMLNVQICLKVYDILKDEKK